MTAHPDQELLLEQCLLALESGDQPGVEAILAAHPQAADRVRAQLAKLAALGILQGPSTTAAPPQHLGDFRLIRPLGRGGMGIVYLAEQVSLRREVALKLVHPEHRFFPGTRERFRREVLAIARLQHPGIVPVLTSGEADGVAFFAMERVVGASLAEVLHELQGTRPQDLDGKALGAALLRALAKKELCAELAPAPVFAGDWPSVCCRLVAAAALALQHAHEHGVLHRDVKPSNLLLTVAGAVRVIDFGLAAADGEQRITRSGAAFGSLPYMAPEQVRGQVSQLGPRTDVYGLGVTLYELLTLSLPHGDGSGTTRERILQGHAEPPAHRNPSVQADADAICLLAMDPDPRRRYASMAAFAADLQAFLDQRTVQARRPSAPLRIKRWAARHPARAAAAVVALLLLGPVPLGFAVQQHFAATRLQAALDAAETERSRAEQLQAAAEQSLQHALTAVDRMLVRTATRELGDQPRTMKLRRSLLEDAVALYEQMLAAAPSARDQRRVDLDRARTEARLGRLCTDLGNPARSVELHRQAIARLLAARPATTGRSAQSILQELVLAHFHLADALGRQDDFDGQIAAAETALEHARELLALDPTQYATAALRREIWLSLATALTRRQGTERGLQLLQAVEAEVAGPPPADLPADQARDWYLCRVHAADNRGILLVGSGDTAAARNAFAASLEICAALPAELQDHHDVRSARLGARQRLGQLELQRRNWPAALPHLDAAIAELETRVAAEPDVVGNRARLAELLGSRATCRLELRELEASLGDFDRAVALLERVVADSPDEPHHRRRLAIARAERAQGKARNGDLEGADRDLGAGTELLAQVVAQLPHDDIARGNLAAMLANHARLLSDRHETGRARAEVDRALALARDRVAGERERSLIELLALASDLAMRDLDPDPGERHITEASQLAAAWLAAKPDDPLRQGTAAMIEVNRGTMYLQLGDHDQARAIWEAALPNARLAAQAGPFGLRVLTIALLRLTDVALRDGDVPRARTWFAAALAETKVEPRMVRGMPPLDRLFEAEQLRDLVPGQGK